MISTLLPQLGGELSQRRESLWKTQSFIATTDDVEHGCIVGKSYVLWVAQKDGQTSSPKPKEVKKGDWFVVEQA